jgi:DNA-binding CsgD family transcriptional regulator
MDHSLSNPVGAFRERIVKVIKDDLFLRKDQFPAERSILPEKYKSLLDNINGFIVISDYTTGLYEYISESVQSNLGYDLKGYTKEQLTNFMFSIIHEKHGEFLLNSLLPTVFQYFKENSTSVTGTDYRYTCSIKLKNIYNLFHWYLVDTVIIEVNESGFPLTTLITCTNINQFKKDECVYYNIMKKNTDGVYEVMLEGTDDNKKNEYNLTSREIEIINLIGQGYTNKQIAEKLYISLNTVQTHRKNLLKKIQCTGTAELTNFAFSRGWL